MELNRNVECPNGAPFDRHKAGRSNSTQIRTTLSVNRKHGSLNIITEKITKELNVALKTASGFGGSNSAMVFIKNHGLCTQ